MFKILRKKELSPNIFLMDVQAPRVAASAKPGQFVIVRVDEKGERVPLTICDYNREEGSVTIVTQVVGASSQKICSLNEGEALLNFVGPLGRPSEFVYENIEDLRHKKILFIAGGVGTAPVYPNVKWLKEQGVEADVIIGSAVMAQERYYVRNSRYTTHWHALDAVPDVEDAEPRPEPLSEEEKPELDALIAAVKSILGDQVKDVRVATKAIDGAACLVSPDGVSSSMEKLMRVMQKSDGIPQKILELNPDHALVRALMHICKSGADDDTFKDMVNTLFDTTLLLDGYMNEPFAMAERNMRLLRQAAGWYSDLRK